MELVKSVIIAVIAAVLIITFVFETVSVDGQSMVPTLNNKDRLIVEKVSYYFRKPKANDIVVIKYPADTREKFIKRVIAVAGDRVKIEDNRLYVNGKEMAEPYINEKIINGSYKEAIVPENTIFVLGDNRNYSRDSRSKDVGFISTKLIIGKALLRIYPLTKIGRIV
jgi:signal peptidase I